MAVRPLEDRILIKPLEAETKTKSGIFLPESAKEKPMQGTILAIGSGRVSDEGTVTPLQVQVGDVVAFGKYAGTEIQVNGEERLILREEDILGVIED